MTNAEWWKMVDDNWEDLVNLIDKFHPNCARFDPAEYPISAQRAENYCKTVREQTDTKQPVGAAVICKEMRDAIPLITIFNETWFGVPESMASRGEPGFFVLCDCCSEYEPEEV